MAQEFKRWYDHDPELIKLMNILKEYRNELKQQAESFLESVEKKVSKESIDKFYNMVKPLKKGSRWYDDDPVISKTVELLRIVPPEVQRNAAHSFIETLKANGIVIE